ncbi:MAG: hypothetical protein M1457_00040 [bacterium]|nr:hypothetical protein [bacterium]
MGTVIFRAGTAAAAPAAGPVQDVTAFPLRLLPEHAHSIEATANADGSLTLTVTGSDPYIYTSAAEGEIDDTTTFLLSFEYKAPQKLAGMDIFFYPPGKAFAQITGLELKAAPAWTKADFNLKRLAKVWDGRSKSFRFDFGDYVGYAVTIRNVILHAPSAEDLERFKQDEQRDKAFFAACGIGLDGVAPQTGAMETINRRDPESAVAVMSVYKHMDLDALTKMGREDPSAKAPVPLAPVIVAGEGEHPANHTVVRVLSPYQVVETQFLAWPPEVTGGVGVEALRLADGRPCFAAWPLASAQVREVRIFNRYGGLVKSVAIADKIAPPYVVCAGRFVASAPGDVLAVAARRSEGVSAPVLFYSPEGKPPGRGRRAGRRPGRNRLRNPQRKKGRRGRDRFAAKPQPQGGVCRRAGPRRAAGEDRPTPGRRAAFRQRLR